MLTTRMACRESGHKRRHDDRRDPDRASFFDARRQTPRYSCRLGIKRRDGRYTAACNPPGSGTCRTNNPRTERSARMNSRISAIVLLALTLATATHPAVAQPVQTRPPTELRLSVEPLLSIGLMEGPDEYLLAGVNGGARLADGSVVVSDRTHSRIQRFGPDGRHLWSRGRDGEGPGEFKYVQLAAGCASMERIVVYDIWTDRVSVFSGDGELLDDYRFLYNGVPLRRFGCAPDGRLDFLGSSVRTGEEGAEPGDLIRELLSLGSAELGDTAATMVRDRIPSSEIRYLGPGDAMPGSIWSHDVVFATNDHGVWLGTSEDYELELIGPAGETIRRIRWDGPDLSVTPADIDRYRDALEASYQRRGNADWRARFARRWEWESEVVPDVFPAYQALMVGDDGMLWVQDYIRPGERDEWFGFDPDGTWTRTLVLPPRTDLLDVGLDWALVQTRDDLDVQRVATHALVENRARSPADPSPR